MQMLIEGILQPLRCLQRARDTTMGHPENQKLRSRKQPLRTHGGGRRWLRLIIAMLKEARERMERTRRACEAMAAQYGSQRSGRIGLNAT